MTRRQLDIFNRQDQAAIDKTAERVRKTEATWPLRFTVNGKPVEVAVDPEESLYDTLRERLRLTGTKGACLEGECGSCTVLLDGKPVTACLVMAPQVAGRKVTTIEGLAADDRLHAVQESFIAAGAVQCGYCTPGLIVSAAALLEENPQPTADQVREALEGNLCRCTGYTKIIDAVLDASSSGTEDKANAGVD
ncbi:MAG: (2Fe-2S)-binding protein [Deltaproteobacteria bacterium]|nr:(2Fe-2S)-binding protein [Deltaproteobacteria bacterium]